MRKCKINFMSALLAFVMALLVPSVDAYAADMYTVTFRPGNVGYFATEANPQGNRQVMAEIVAAQEYSGYKYDVTANGAIKVTVSAGDIIPAAPTYIQTEDGYFVKNISTWGPSGEKIDRNVDYVVDYGKLVDGVEYTVKYVDSESGESIAPVYITQANVGEKRTVTAPDQIVVSGSVSYALVSQEAMGIVLDSDANKNVITFLYEMQEQDAMTEIIVVEEEGETRTSAENSSTIRYITTVIDGEGADGEGGNNEGGNNEGVNNEGVDTQGQIVDDQVVDEEDVEVVDIIDEETPLAGNTTGEDGNEDVLIDDEEVPLAPAAEEPLADMARIGATVFVIAAVLLAAMWLYMKKFQTGQENDLKEE